MEPSAVQQDEPPSSTGGGGTGVNHAPRMSPMNHGNSPNGNIGHNKFEYDRDKTDMIPTTLWNSTTGKLAHHKQATINTPDGK